MTNWDALGAIGEIVGAIAVVFSLIYLAIQVKLVRETTNRNTRQMRNTGIRELFMGAATSGELANIWAEAEKNLGGTSYMLEAAERIAEKAEITEADAIRLMCHNLALYYHYRTVYYSGLSGEELESLKQNMARYFSSAVAKLVLANFATIENEEFAIEMQRYVVDRH